MGKDEGGFRMNDLVIRLRRFKDRKSLDRVAPRMLDKAAAAGLQEELKVIAAIDHRQAEIAAGRHYDAGKVPMTAWALVD
jgi:predicted transcriptional regulator